MEWYAIAALMWLSLRAGYLLRSISMASDEQHDKDTRGGFRKLLKMVTETPKEDPKKGKSGKHRRDTGKKQ